MLHNSRATADSDEEPLISRAYCLRTRTGSFNPNEIAEPMQEVPDNIDRADSELEEVYLDQIKYDSPELQSGKYYVVPIGGLT